MWPESSWPMARQSATQYFLGRLRRVYRVGVPLYELKRTSMSLGGERSPISLRAWSSHTAAAHIAGYRSDDSTDFGFDGRALCAVLAK